VGRVRAIVVAAEKEKLLHALSLRLWPWVSSMQFACAIMSFVACSAELYFSTVSHKWHEFRER